MEANTNGKSAQKPAKKKRRIIWRVLGFGTLAFLLFLIGAGAWAYQQGTDLYNSTDISKLDKEPPRSTLIYDRNGQVITELTNAKIDYIPHDQFAETVKQAIVAVEDSRFYEHKGVDPEALGRALYTNIRNKGFVQGGSTITQQLAKTLLFKPDKTLERKLNEAVAAVKIEQNYTKEQILEMYLNHIYFGKGAWGIQRAAQVYFGKEAKDLTLAESALLAGLPKAPNDYSPAVNLERAKERRNLVLSLMAEQGRITAEERDKAQAEEIRLAEKSVLAAANKYPSYVDHVINEAIGKYGLTEQEVLSSGLQIHTNLDPVVQEAAEEVYRDPKHFPDDKGGLQSAVVLMDPKTGAVVGIVGSRNQEREFRAFNWATMAERQPGSAIKPIVVFAPALKAGFQPYDLVNDAETDFGKYKPNNYGEKFHGWVTVEESLMHSYNVPAVALLKEVGIGKAVEFAKQAGLPLQNSDRVFGLALGGMTKGTSPLVMAQAYTMFANGGKLSQAYAITKILDKNNKVIEEAKPVVKEMLDPNTAYTMTAMMQRVVTEGTGRTAMLDRNVAGKTGTTQLPDIPEFKDKAGNQIDGSKDAWFVGFTNELLAAVWVGYPVTNRTHYLTTTGGKMPAAIFKEVMSRALKDSPASVLSPPSGYTFAMGEPKLINANAELTLVQGGRSPDKSVGVAAVSVPTKSPAATAPPTSTPINTTVKVIVPELVGASSQPPATPVPGTAANAPAQAVQSPKPETTKPEPTAAQTSTPTPAATKQPSPTTSPATPAPTVKPTSTASPTPVPDNGNSTTVTTEPKATVKPESDDNMEKSAKKQNR